MQILASITEHDMVATFLKAEVNSERWSQTILDILERNSINRKIIDEPDTSDLEENLCRLQVLGDFRGYKQHQGMFESFPDNISWYRAVLHQHELAQVRYIDYSYWVVLSGGSRLPSDAARNIHAGIQVFGQSTEGFLNVARALQGGTKFPELILVSVDDTSPLVVVEGHVRLTTYFLAPQCLPDELTVLVGFSPNIVEWGLY